MTAAVVGLAGCTTTPDSHSRSDTARLSAADESAVRSVVAEFAKTWNRHDMKAMHELNTAEVEWINVTANHWRGNASVFKGHDTIHRTVFAKTDMSVDQTLVRAIPPNVAIAVATMKFGPVTIPSGQVLPELRTRGSFTMVKKGGSWKIPGLTKKAPLNRRRLVRFSCEPAGGSQGFGPAGWVTGNAAATAAAGLPGQSG